MGRVYPLPPRPPWDEHRPFEWGWRAVELCSPCLWWWGRLCRGGVPLGAVPALSWCGEVPLGAILFIIIGLGNRRLYCLKLHVMG